MDELRAYQILKIEPGSSREEIKEAYAALSKEFHPEEYPEEFQQIHEAYVTLTRGSRRSRSVSKQQNEAMFNFDYEPVREEEKKEPEKTGYSYNFRNVKYEEEVQEETEPQYDFESAVHQAENQEKARLHEITLQALAEMKVLLSPNYREKYKHFLAFFRNEKYKEALRTPEFLMGFARLLDEPNLKLKRLIYDLMIDYYRLRGVERARIVPEAVALYDVLDRKRGLHAKKNMAWLASIPAIAVVAFRSFRSAIRTTGVIEDINLWPFIFIIVAVLICLGIFRLLYANHSVIFSQFIIAVCVFMFHFVGLLPGLFTAIFGSQSSGDVYASLVVMASLIWMVVLIVIAIIKKIKSIG